MWFSGCNKPELMCKWDLCIKLELNCQNRFHIPKQRLHIILVLGIINIIIIIKYHRNIINLHKQTYIY